MEYLKFAFQGPFIFIGVCILLGIGSETIIRIWNRFWRHWTMMKHGYPPEHIDADGDFKKDHEDD